MVTRLPLVPRKIEAILIGASAGAVDALGEILPLFPAETPVPIVVVVHLSPRHPSLMPELFAPRCALRIREPNDKDPVDPGIVWFAPSDYHLLVERDRTFALSLDEPVAYSRPSVDVLFESAAEVYGPALCAVVLTGANRDGARGARVIREGGGVVVAQDPDSALAPEMPSATIAEADPQIVGSLAEIAHSLRALIGVAS